MDSLRGRFSDQDDYGDRDCDSGDDDTGLEPLPSPVGQDERRMQVRAYNHWASLLGERHFPSIEDLEPENLPDFSPYSVLLDFTGGIEDPGIPFLGDKLGEECLADGTAVEHLSDVPSRSLLSRITDHYMQILANQAPIGFEAEFVNVRGATILYRGILLPFSSDDDTIDFIYGVINWKELADQKTSDELLLEIDQALNPTEPERNADEAPLTAWADGPVDVGSAEEEPLELDETLELAEPEEPVSPVLQGPFATGRHGPIESGEPVSMDWPRPSFGDFQSALDDDDDAAPTQIQPLFGDGGILAKKDRSGHRVGMLTGAALTPREVADEAEAVTPEQGAYASYDDPALTEAALPTIDVAADDMGLADWLASARELAQAAKGSEDRSRQALYAAIGRAYDFSLAAQAEPAEFAALVADAGLTVQDRAPMTPVVKLVFGADYDKTRLTEYASALSHGYRLKLGQGALVGFLASAEGGLKGIVQLERALKRQENGKPAARRAGPSDAVVRKLRKLDHRPLTAVASEGEEFTLLVARRLPDGEIVLLGEVADDVPMLERAARKLLD